MASAVVVAKRMPGEAWTPSRAAPWRAELEALGALLADERLPGDALRARITRIVAEEAGDRLSPALVRRIAERTAQSLG